MTRAIAWVIGISKEGTQLKVRCPYCDDVHVHGSAGGLGTRAPHCWRIQRCLPDYELVLSELLDTEPKARDKARILRVLANPRLGEQKPLPTQVH